MSLLGYLVPRIAASGEEPAATQALAYLLNASTGIAEAFVGIVAPTGIEGFTPGRIAAEELGLDVQRLERTNLLRLSWEPRQAGVLERVVEREEARRVNTSSEVARWSCPAFVDG